MHHGLENQIIYIYKLIWDDQYLMPQFCRSHIFSDHEILFQFSSQLLKYTLKTNINKRNYNLLIKQLSLMQHSIGLLIVVLLGKTEIIYIHLCKNGSVFFLPLMKNQITGYYK